MRWVPMSEELYGYVLRHCNPHGDAVSAQLAATTKDRFGDLAGMNIGEDQGRFLQMLVQVTGARTVVEVGTFTGMSALWLARGLPSEGRLICFELSDRYLATATEAWTEAGINEHIEVRIGPAAEGLAALPEEPHVDLAFVDADKGGYSTYLDLLLPRMRDHAVIAVDNTLRGGSVLDPDETSPDTAAIRDFNDDVAGRDDCDAVMLTIGDGVTLIRPRRP